LLLVDDGIRWLGRASAIVTTAAPHSLVGAAAR
jgi:hypothetical protein